MKAILEILSGVSALLLLASVIAWGYEYARKEPVKHSHHFWMWAIIFAIITFALMELEFKIG